MSTPSGAYAPTHGGYPGPLPVPPCVNCNGQGEVPVSGHLITDDPSTLVTRECYACDGTGEAR